MSDEIRWREKLEVLDGSRRKTTARRAAVRIEDLQALLQVRSKLRAAKAAGATPTKAEFDALVDDMNDLHNIILALQEALQKRILP